MSTDLHTENCDPEFGCDETCTTPLPPDEAVRCVLTLADELESLTVNRNPAPGSYDAGVVAAFVNVAARFRSTVALGEARCRCDGGSYEMHKHPFLIHPDCPIHAAALREA